MKYFDWSIEKNATLRMEREVSFEDVVVAISEGRLLDILKHPNRKRYPNQQIFVIEINHYAYLVPFMEDNQKIFLKTIIPSRKATRDYIIKKK
ncbi:MAG: toxin [bacterium]|nr:toxin [bacterium]